MLPYRIVALDLDGTLLNSNKELTPGNRAALEQAAARGVEIVPCTGRFYGALPEAIRELPFVNYVITMNGAQIYDVRARQVLQENTMSQDLAIRVMEFMDTLPVIYDCYSNNAAYMTEAMQAQCDIYAPDPHFAKMLRELRQPVPELKDFLRQWPHPVQKMQMFFLDVSLRDRILEKFPKLFPEILATTSVRNNIELNINTANKGAALAFLAAHLGCPMSQTMACGDGLNDRHMIEAAGCGVAMGNAVAPILALADFVTRSCDQDGVAYAIETLCLPYGSDR